MKEKLIYVVDDDADDREVVRDAFLANDSSIHCQLIETGDSLLELLEASSSTTPSLIVLDLNMPGKDGREVLKELKSQSAYRTIPVVVFTTSSSQQDKLISYEAGANCFVSKPDTFDRLTDLARCFIQLWVA